MDSLKPQFVTPEDIYKAALRYIGTDASPNDEAPDELGCAESVSDILFNAGCIMPTFLSTTKLNYFLKTSQDWEAVAIPKRGDIIISPTGLGGRGGISHGHTGIVMEEDLIASNNSRTGKFERNFLLSQWKHHWVVLGGYPMLFYRKRFTVPPVPITPEETRVVVEAIEVSKEAIKHPKLWPSLSNILSWLGRFLATKK